MLSCALLACGGSAPNFHASETTLPAHREGPSFAGPSTIHLRHFGQESAEVPVVAIHGVGQTAGAEWEAFASALSGRQVVAPDLPGFGESQAIDAPDPIRIADALIPHLRPFAPFDLVGHSMGGAVAIELAARAPELIRSLALVDVAGVLHREAFVGASVRRSLESTGPLQGFAESAVGAMRAFEPGEETIRGMSGDGQGGAMIGLIYTDLGPALRSLRNASFPVKIYWGSEDTVAPIRTAFALEGRLGAPLHIEEGAGHNPLVENPAGLAQWFASAPSPRALPETASQELVRCEGQREPFVVRGQVRRVELLGCSDVRIESARIEELIAEESTIQVIGGSAGLSAVKSTVVITGTELTSLTLSDSRLDLAGAILHGPIQVAEPSRVLFSVTEYRSENPASDLQGAVVIQ